MPAPDPLRSAVALRAMTRFGCLGGACEDTCCQRWSISIDEAHYRALAERMSAPEDRARFDAAFALRPEAERTPAGYARIRLRILDEHCPLLDDERTCSIHRRFGEAALPDVCASYPRLGRVVGDRFEVHGSMSCPEVVRRVLLDEDGAELDALAPEEAHALGRVPVADRAVEEDAALLDEARGGALLILDQRRFPLAARLRLLAWLAEEATPEPADDEATPGPAGDDGASEDESATDPEALADAVELAASDEVLDSIADELAGAAPTPAAAEALVAQLARLRTVVRPSFVPALDRVLDALVADGVLARTSDALHHTGDLAAALAALAARLPPETLDALDARLERYARAFILRELAPRRAPLAGQLRELILRVATLRLLALTHPDVLSDEADDGDDAVRARWLVTATYQIARLADHGRDVRDALFAGTAALLPTAWDVASVVATAFPDAP